MHMTKDHQVKVVLVILVKEKTKVVVMLVKEVSLVKVVVMLVKTTKEEKTKEKVMVGNAARCSI